MVQTTPAALLGVNTSDKGLGGSNKSGDDGAFSREFEQVSRGTEPRHNRAEATAESANKEHSPTDAAKASEQGPSEQASLSEETEQTDVAASGKSLPPTATLEDEEALFDSDEAALADVQQELNGVLQTLVQQDSKQVLSTTAESKPIVSGAMATKSGDAIAEVSADADRALSFSSLRLRDMTLINQSGAGSDAGGQAALRQGKGDAALFTLVNSSSSHPGNFGEMLNLSAASGTLTPTQPSASTLPAQMTLALPVQQRGWDQAMGERVVWMARSNIQQAQIQLNPRELGPIEIKISVQNEQTHVNFVAHHATTREAIEAALPRLREMLGEQGLNLGQADVSQHSFGDSQRQAGVGDEGRNLNGSQQGLAEDEAEGEVILHESRVPLGAVDFFA